MNIKNRIKTIACACACVLSIGAFADYADWFSGGVDTKQDPNILEALEASWNVASLPADGIKIEDGNIVLENDIDTPLKLKPNAGLGDDATKIVEVTATAVLTPSDVDDLPKNIDGAKTGFAVARYIDANDKEALGYYGYNGADWTLLTGATPAGPDANDVYPETTFTVVLNYRDGTASFKVGTTALTGTITLPANTTALASVDAFGTGSLASIDAKYEKAVAAVGNKKYGSIAEAFENKGAAEVEVVGANGEIDKTPAANGMPRWEAKVLALDETDEDAKVTVVPTDDSDAENITLKLANTENMDPAFAVAIKVLKNGKQQGETCAANAVKIPLATGVYTIEPVVTLKNN